MPSPSVKTLAGWDVARVRQHARVLLEVDENGFATEFRENASGKLNVLAVVGPGRGLDGTRAQGLFESPAVLLEIGLWRTKPYRALRTNVSQRRKWFVFLNEEQYRRTAAEVFEYLQLYANQRVSAWESGPDFWLPYQKHYWSRTHRTTFVWNGMAAQPRGVRFTLSPLDREIVNDIHALECRNPSIESLSKFIDLRLRPYRKGFLDLKRLKGFSEAAAALERSSLSQVAKLEVVRRLSRPRKTQFGPHLLKVIGVGETGSTEELLRRRSSLRPEYTDGIGIRVIRESEKYLVTEIFSNLPAEEGESYPTLSEVV